MLSDEYVINPETGKPIKRNTRAYNNLVKKGIIPDDSVEKNPKVLYKIKPSDEEDDIQQVKNQINETPEMLENDEQCVKGRGSYQDKLVRRKVVPKTTKVIRKTKEFIQEKPQKTQYTDLEKMILKVLESSDDDADSDFD